jgi:DUF1365 family protein
MRSQLLTGKVRHRRPRPFTYQLEHDVFYLALDTRELDEAAGRLRLLRRNRPWVVAFRDSDHLPEPARDLDADVRSMLRAHGVPADDWAITLVAYPRVLGHVFNPASFFLCRDGAGVLRVVIVEVHNTFGERHAYVLRQGSGAGPAAVAGGGVAAGAGATEAAFTASMSKDFFVSPFISEDGRYAVHVRDDADALRLSIVLRQDGEITLSTSLLLRRRPLTDASLLRALLRHPLMPQRTLLLIHWHAIRLWLKGAPFFRHGAWLRARSRS